MKKAIIGIYKSIGEISHAYYVCTSDSDRTFKMGGYDFSIKLDKIIEEKKNVGPGDILVYRCYIKNNVVFEIEANSSLIIEYEYN